MKSLQQFKLIFRTTQSQARFPDPPPYTLITRRHINRLCQDFKITTISSITFRSLTSVCVNPPTSLLTSTFICFWTLWAKAIRYANMEYISEI